MKQKQFNSEQIMAILSQGEKSIVEVYNGPENLDTKTGGNTLNP